MTTTTAAEAATEEQEPQLNCGVCGVRLWVDAPGRLCVECVLDEETICVRPRPRRSYHQINADRTSDLADPLDITGYLPKWRRRALDRES